MPKKIKNIDNTRSGNTRNSGLISAGNLLIRGAAAITAAASGVFSTDTGHMRGYRAEDGSGLSPHLSSPPSFAPLFEGGGLERRDLERNGVQIPGPLIPAVSSSGLSHPGNANFQLPTDFATNNPVTVFVSGVVPKDTKFIIPIQCGNVAIQLRVAANGDISQFIRVGSGKFIKQKGFDSTTIEGKKDNLYCLSISIGYNLDGTPAISLSDAGDVLIGRPKQKADQYTSGEDFYGTGGPVLRTNQIPGVTSTTSDLEALALLMQEMTTPQPENGYPLSDAYAHLEPYYAQFEEFSAAGDFYLYDLPNYKKIAFGDISVGLKVPKAAAAKKSQWQVSTSWETTTPIAIESQATHKKKGHKG